MGVKSLGLPEYNRVHQWVRRHFSKTGMCENCNVVTKTQWSNKDDQYTLDRDSWQELCVKCHVKYDIEVIGIYRRNRKPLSSLAFVRQYRKDLPRLRQYAWWVDITDPEEYFKINYCS